MKTKDKRCNGIGKAKGFSGCGELTAYRKSGLCLSDCYPKWLFNTPEGKETMNKAIIKVKAPRISLEKAIKEDKETKGIQAALHVTKKVVHNMVRLRDKGKPCISCNAQWNDSFEAGHCYPTKYRSIRFWFYNINGQCFGCNNLKSGNETEYLLRLPSRIGQENFNELQRLAALDNKFNKHWTRDELAEIRKEARKIIKKLK